MDYKEFEDKLSGQFGEFTPEGLDQDALWAEVEAELPKKEKRRFIWFLLPGLLLVGLTAIVMLSIIPNRQTDGQTTAVEKQQQSRQLTGSSKEQPAQNEQAAELGQGKLEETQVAKSPTERILSKRKNDYTIKNEVSILKNDSSTKKTGKNTALAGKENTVKAVKLGVAKIASNIIVNKADQTVETEIENDKVRVRKSNAETKDAAQPKPVQEKVQEESVRKSQDTAKEESSDSALKEEQAELPKQSTAKTMENKQEEIKVKIAEEAPISKQETDMQPKTISLFSLGLSAGYYRPKASYNETALSKLHQQAETNLEAFDASLSIKVDIHKRWGISSGLYWSRIHQGSVNTRIFERAETSDEVVVGQVFSPNGNYFLFEEGELMYEVTQTYQRYLSYESIAIPVQVHFSPLVGKKWQLELAAGYEYSLSSKSSGYIQDNDGTEYNLSIDTDKRLQSKSSHYALLGISAAYNITHKVEWQFGIQSKIATTGLYKDELLFQKQFLLPGIRTGIFFNL